MNIKSQVLVLSIALGSAILPLAGCQSGGGSAAAIKNDDAIPSIGARAALADLCAKNAGAASLAAGAKGVLVFPQVTKGGFIVGGYHGQGRMIQNGRIAGAYQTTGLSYGLQAGLQQFAYAMFFMSEEDLRHLDKSGGWELGTAPNITIIDAGAATSLSTTSARKGVYCFFFDQTGLMAGLGLQGSKINKVQY